MGVYMLASLVTWSLPRLRDDYYRDKATYSWIDTAQLQMDIDKLLAIGISNRQKCIDIELVFKRLQNESVVKYLYMRKGTELPASVMITTGFYSLDNSAIGNASNTVTTTLRKHCRHGVISRTKGGTLIPPRSEPLFPTKPTP